MRSAPVLSPEATREFIIEQVEYIEGRPDFVEPTPQELEIFASMVDQNQANTPYQANRGIRELAPDLDMNMSDLEALLKGKTILDIGCGDGKFSTDASRLKRTEVTALDLDEQRISGITPSRNLRPIVGDAYNLADSIGDDKFDVVVSAYSGHHWARSPERKKSAIEQALSACAVGGTVLFIPIMHNVGHSNVTRVATDAGLSRLGHRLTPEEQTEFGAYIKVCGWSEVLAIDTLLEYEQGGDIDLTFVSSRDNKKKQPIRRELTREIDHAQDRYSAIVKVLQ